MEYTNLEVALLKRLQVTYTHKQRVGNTTYTNCGKLNNLRWSKLKPADIRDSADMRVSGIKFSSKTY